MCFVYTVVFGTHNPVGFDNVRIFRLRDEDPGFVIVMNDSSNSPERANSPEPMLTQREARSVSWADADPGGTRQTQWGMSPASRNSASSMSTRRAQRETSSVSLNPVSPEYRKPQDMAPSSVDKIFTQHVDGAMQGQRRTFRFTSEVSQQDRDSVTAI